MRYGKGPHRQCIGCRGVFPKGELMRFVHDGTGSAVFDETQRLEGRGKYLCPQQDCVARAWKNRKGKALLKDENTAQKLVSSVRDALMVSVERLLESSKNERLMSRSCDDVKSLEAGDAILIRDDITWQGRAELTEIAATRRAQVFAVPPKVLNWAERRVIKMHSPKNSPIVRNLRFYERLSFKGRDL